MPPPPPQTLPPCPHGLRLMVSLDSVGFVEVCNDLIALKHSSSCVGILNVGHLHTQQWHRDHRQQITSHGDSKVPLSTDPLWQKEWSDGIPDCDSHLEVAPLLSQEGPLGAVARNRVVQVWQLQLNQSLHTQISIFSMFFKTSYYCNAIATSKISSDAMHQNLVPVLHASNPWAAACSSEGQAQYGIEQQ